MISNDKGNIYYSVRKAKGIEFGKGHVDVTYINWIRDDATVGNDDCVKSLIRGPDVIQKGLFDTQQMRLIWGVHKRLHAEENKSSNFPNILVNKKTFQVNHATSQFEYNLIDILQGFPNRRQNRKSSNGRQLKVQWTRQTLNSNECLLNNVHCLFQTLNPT